MGNIDWKQKLSSRKFWVLIAGLFTSIILLIQGDPTATVGGCVMALGSIVAYILGESWVDASNAGSTKNVTTTTISASTNAKEVVVDAIKGSSSSN